MQRPCLLALKKGHLDIVRFLVEARADKDQAPHSGETPLFIAAQEGHLDMVRFLFEAGSEKDRPKNRGAMPLLIAAQKGHLDVVRFLVETGADNDQAKGDGAIHASWVCWKCCYCLFFDGKSTTSFFFVKRCFSLLGSPQRGSSWLCFCGSTFFFLIYNIILYIYT